MTSKAKAVFDSPAYSSPGTLAFNLTDPIGTAYRANSFGSTHTFFFLEGSYVGPSGDAINFTASGKRYYPESDLNLLGPYTPPTSPNVDLNLGDTPVVVLPTREVSLRVRFSSQQVVHQDLDNLGLVTRHAEVRPISFPKCVVRVVVDYDNRVYRPDIIKAGSANWKPANPSLRPQIGQDWAVAGQAKPDYSDDWKVAQKGSIRVGGTHRVMLGAHQSPEDLDWGVGGGVSSGSGDSYSVMDHRSSGSFIDWDVAAHLKAATMAPTFRGDMTHDRVHDFIPWGPGDDMSFGLVSGWNWALPVSKGWLIPWREAGLLISGRPIPHPLDDKYIFSTELDLQCALTFHDVTRTKVRTYYVGNYVEQGHVLNFNLSRQIRPGEHPVATFLGEPVTEEYQEFVGRYAVDPLMVDIDLSIYPCGKREDQATIIIPILRVYFVKNSMTLFRVSDGTEIEVNSGSVDIDRSTWAWGFSASIPFRELYKVEPTSNGPVEVELQLNGLRWRFLVETFDSNEEFLNSACSIKGRSVTALLDDPYSAKGDLSVTSSKTAQQLASAELSRAVDSSFDLDWSLVPNDSTDWVVPANAFSYQGLTPVQSISQIVGGVQGILNSHPYMRRLIVKSRYPKGPYWNWATATPDIEIPRSVVKRRSLSWDEKPDYNGVYVSGDQYGVNAFVRRAGTAGEYQAPTHVSSMISGPAPAQEAGIAILGGYGRQAKVTLEVPLVITNNYVMPGTLILVNNEGDGPNWRGGVQGVSISGAWDQSGGLVISQSITLERHY